MRQPKRRKVANDMEIGYGSEDDDMSTPYEHDDMSTPYENDEIDRDRSQYHYDDDDDDDASSMNDEPNADQRDDENTGVERSVKMVRLCKRTGKKDQNVTVYGLARGPLDIKCNEPNLLSCSYEDEMTERRASEESAASAEGKESRYGGEYNEDLSRGPARLENVLKHSLRLYKYVEEQKAVDKEEYERKFKITMVNLCDKSAHKTKSRICCPSDKRIWKESQKNGTREAARGRYNSPSGWKNRLCKVSERREYERNGP